MQKAKHAFGSSSGIEAALRTGKIDAYDILFLDGDTDKPKVGWIDKNGKAVILKDEKADLTELESEVAELETEVSKKANADEVASQIGTAMVDSVNASKAYTDGKIEAAVNEHLLKKYEITSVPSGAIVDYREKEIRVMCPVGTEWVKQSVGPTGNPNMVYMGFKAYAPKNAVSFKEGDRGVIIDKMFTFDDDFAGTDEYGRNFSICWLALASYDESSDTWTYFGKNSSAEKYIGWDYVVEWFDVNGVMIATDSVRINLSNEECHFINEPYYVGKIKKEVNLKIEEMISEMESTYEIIEF